MDRSNVVAILQEVGGKGVSQRVAARRPRKGRRLEPIRSPGQNQRRTPQLMTRPSRGAQASTVQRPSTARAGRSRGSQRDSPFDAAYHAAVSETLEEWASPEDEEAFRDLGSARQGIPARTT
jgi:hypothetical protein